MSREIKFRTPVICQNGHKALWYWRINPDRLSEVKVSGVIDSQKCPCPKGELGQGYQKNGDDQEYTGLKDKNGKEIYEGDWIKVTDALSSKYQVFWTRGYWAVKSISGIIFMLIDCVEGTGCEVIGNIYEHSNLIDTKTKK